LFQDLGLADLALVGGKNASLGEMSRGLGSKGVPVPPGFATTAAAYWDHLDAADLRATIRQRLEKARSEGHPPETAGAAIRADILGAPLPDRVAAAIREAYDALCVAEGVADLPVAVRSSATAEDLPEASFAGQQDSFLNVRGADHLIDTCRRCFASLFTDRAIAYREGLGFDHLAVALSVGVQRMVRSDLACAGVLFTLDTDTGFPRLAVVSSAWGLGESVVKGTVEPDHFRVFKPLVNLAGTKPIVENRIGAKAEKVVYLPDGGGVHTVPTSTAERAATTLTDEEVLSLVRWGVVIEDHYQTPMDIEWAKDGPSGQLFIVQARPETVWSRRPPVVVSYRLIERAEPLVQGIPVGNSIATGRVMVVGDPSEARDMPTGAVLVTHRTDPDWGPFLRRAGAVITDHGGTTSHAAIVCRELGVPAVVGTGNGTRVLTNGAEVTVSCETDVGLVFPGALEFRRTEERIDDLPRLELPVLMNVGTPGVAFRSWALPARGVGLARLEFLIGDVIGIHPMALLRPDAISPDERAQIARLTEGFADPATFFVARLAQGIAQIAASVFPNPAVVRTSDFKTNEYAKLLGGSLLEQFEENPMIGFRGASRYVAEEYRPAFELECRALRIAREEMGFTNVIPMIPFCRTLDEADQVLAIMADCGLVRGRDGLQIFVMCEVPSNVILAREFAQRFDGFSIGSNDLTQLTLGVDRDNAALASVFDESNTAVTRLIEMVVRIAHEEGRTVGFCGQAPSNDPAYAEFLLRTGIDSVSVDPDSVIAVTRRLATVEKALAVGA
jgi:pyruvate,water dikinase